MRETKKTKATKKQLYARDVAEEALEIMIKNVPLDCHIIKALRRTCKRTKVAADATVKQFSMTVDQGPRAIRSSRLLTNITKIIIDFDLRADSNGPDDWDARDDQEFDHTPSVYRAVDLLKLVVEVCGESLEALEVGIIASYDSIYQCGCVLGDSDWESLKELSTQYNADPMPRFLSGIIDDRPGRPGSFPALERLLCLGPSADDIKSLNNSAFVANLTSLSLEFHSSAHNLNTAPAMIGAMRTLLQKASNLETLDIISQKFDFFDSEQLSSLKSLHLQEFPFVVPLFIHNMPIVRADVAPVLARPWPKLESLRIGHASLKSTDLVRILEAEDTLPMLKELEITNSSVLEDALSCVRRPHLEKLVLIFDNALLLISKLAQLMSAATYPQPKLKKLYIDCGLNDADSATLPLEALIKFISCPCMASVEDLGIYTSDIGGKNTGVLLEIADHCRNLKCLSLQVNNIGRLAVDLLVEYIQTKSWPHLQKLGILHQGLNNPNNFPSDPRYMPRHEMKSTLQSVWPGLVCF